MDNRWLHLGVLLLLCSLVVVRSAVKIGDSSGPYDSTQYLGGAYRLIHDKVFDFRLPGDPSRPSAVCMPGYPTFLAAGLLLTPSIKNLPPKEYRKVSKFPHRSLGRLKALQAGLLLLTSLLAMGLVRRITGSRWAGYLALLAVGFSPTLVFDVNHINVEMLVATMLMIMGGALLWLVLRPGWRTFALAGFTLGLLTLCRAVYAYAWPVFLMVVAWVAWRQPTRRRQLLVGTLIFLGCYLLPTGAWMTRNYVHFGRAFLAERGGNVLLTRANYDGMTGTEYRAAFIYWLPKHSSIRKPLLERWFSYEDYQRLNRAEADGYWGSAWNRWHDPARTHDTKLDQELLAEAKERIRAQWARHLAVTLPIAWRGLFIESRYLVVSLFLWASLVGFIILGLRRRRADWLILAAPVLYHFGFHAFLTHNLPRFNHPVLPLLWVSAILFFWEGWGRWLWDRLRLRAAAGNADGDGMDPAPPAPGGRSAG